MVTGKKSKNVLKEKHPVFFFLVFLSFRESSLFSPTPSAFSPSLSTRRGGVFCSFLFAWVGRANCFLLCSFSFTCSLSRGRFFTSRGAYSPHIGEEGWKGPRHHNRCCFRFEFFSSLRMIGEEAFAFLL